MQFISIWYLVRFLLHVISSYHKTPLFIISISSFACNHKNIYLHSISKKENHLISFFKSAPSLTHCVPLKPYGVIELGQYWFRYWHYLNQLTRQNLLGFYRTKEGFWPDFADFKHDYTQEFYCSTHLLSANVRGPESFVVSGNQYWLIISKVQWHLSKGIIIKSEVTNQ